jgi:hypothetical protein
MFKKKKTSWVQWYVPVIPAVRKAEVEGPPSLRPCSGVQNSVTLSKKQIKAKMVGDMAQIVEFLRKALSSTLVLPKKKEKASHHLF